MEAAKEETQGLTVEELTLIETRLGNEGKSVVVAYLLYLFLGGLGAHNFYLGRIVYGLIQITLMLIGVITLFAAGVGVIFLVPLGITLLVDLFIIPGGVRKDLDKKRKKLIKIMEEKTQKTAT